MSKNEQAIELREKLAELAHKQWSSWIKYMFGKCLKKADGTILIPEWAVTRWRRQAYTPYSKLSKIERELDRTEADKFIALLAEPEKPKREQIIEDNPEESELPAILRDYSDTDDLIPKPVLEKVAERIEDLEGAINNILKHEPEKPTCSTCEGSGRIPDEC